MPMASSTLSTRQWRELTQFIGRSFWILGSLAFTWEMLVVAALLRASPEVSLPLLGDCSGGEALILTLSLFWPVLLALHWVAHAHQRTSRGRDYLSSFPGLLGDMDVPASLAWFRMLAFVLLLLIPSAAHVFLTARAFTHVSLVYKSGDRVLPSPKKDGTLMAYRGWSQLAPHRHLKREDKSRIGEWRWLHWRDEIDRTPRDSEGKIPINPATRKPMARDITASHWPSALPLIQPWGFLLAAIGLSASTLLLLYHPWRRLRLEAASRSAGPSSDGKRTAS